MEKDNLKNAVSNSSEYKKYDSFENLEIKSAQGEKVSKILKEVRPLIEGEKDTYRQKILHRVFNDLEGSGSSEGPTFSLKPNVVEELYRLEKKDYLRYLFYRYRYEIFPQTKEVDDFPPLIQIEPASVCNFRCIFCYQTDKIFTGKSGGHMGTMTLDIFKKIIDECEGRVEAVTLASRGEPLLARDFGQMMSYLEGKFLAVKVNTNASLLTEEKCHEILSSGIQTLVFSADAADKELYSKLRVNGSLEKTLKNVELFHKTREKHYPDSKLISRVSGVKVNTKQDIRDMEEVWGEYVDQVAFVAYNPWENTYQRDLSNESRPCSDLWRRTFVWFDGIVNPCDVDYMSHLKCGDIQDKSISEIWQGEGYNEMRTKHIKGNRCKISPCDRCTVI